MSTSKWAYDPRRCDGQPCPGDCDRCTRWQEEESASLKDDMINDLVKGLEADGTFKVESVKLGWTNGKPSLKIDGRATEEER